MHRVPLPNFIGEMMAVAGFIIGIISAIAYFGLPGIITSIVGLFISYRAFKKGVGNQKLAKIGIGLNLFWLLFGVVGEF